MAPFDSQNRLWRYTRQYIDIIEFICSHNASVTDVQNKTVYVLCDNCCHGNWLCDNFILMQFLKELVATGNVDRFVVNFRPVGHGRGSSDSLFDSVRRNLTG